MSAVGSTQSAAASRVALAALISGNLVVAALALRYQQAYEILLMAFWLEFVAVAVINVPKMLIAAALGRPIRNREDLGDAAGRVATVSFFLLYYAAFLATAAMVTFVLFGFVPIALDALPGGSLLALPERAPRMLFSVWKWIIVAIVFGHAASFVANFLYRREYRQASLLMLAVQPFLRLALTAIVVALALLVAVAQPVVASTTLFAVALAVLKLFADVIGHLRERRRFAPRDDSVAVVAPA